jgi:hypothetical protein
MKRFETLCTVTLAAAAIIGWMSSAAFRPPAAVDRAAPGEPSVVSSPAATTAPADSTVEPRIPAAPAGVAAEVPLSERLRGTGLRSIPESTLTHLRLHVFTFDGSLSAQTIDFFSLDDAEVATLNQSLADTREKLAALELEGMEVVKAESNELVLRLPALENAAVQVEADLKADFLRVMGEPDGEVLWDFMSRPNAPNSGYWDSFGRASREITFRLEPSDQNPDRLMLRFFSEIPSEESRKWLEEEGRQVRGFSKGIYRVPSADWRSHSLGRYEYLWPLLPEEIVSFLTPPE